jgi:hypothetical protein
VNVDVREGGSRSRAKIDFCSRPLRELAMPADKIGMQMRLDDVLDLQALRRSLIDVQRHVALWIHHDRDAFRAEHVRRVRKAGEIKLLKIHLYRL